MNFIIREFSGSRIFDYFITNMGFTVGTLVQVINENLSGKVIAIQQEEVVIETDDGFLVRFRESELIPYQSLNTNDLQVSESVKNTKERPTKKQSILTTTKKNKLLLMEVDLHIDQLRPSSKRMSNFEMLTVQLTTAQRQLDFAIAKKIPRIVFIHGVGSGVLKEELRYILNRYEGLSYYPADFLKYGEGATEVRIFQKKN